MCVYTYKRKSKYIYIYIYIYNILMAVGNVLHVFNVNV